MYYFRLCLSNRFINIIYFLNFPPYFFYLCSNKVEHDLNIEIKVLTKKKLEYNDFSVKRVNIYIF